MGDLVKDAIALTATETGRSDLEPGMVVTTEIQTGRRRIIDYLLSPLQRSVSESMHER